VSSRPKADNGELRPVATATGSALSEKGLEFVLHVVG
jgi:hypothetical protein